MIALDTNALIRMLVEDDSDQAGAVQEMVSRAGKSSTQVLIVSEVLTEAVWVLESVYHCSREEIFKFLETLTLSKTFFIADREAIRRSVHQFKQGGDFANLLIVNQTKARQAKRLFSFDKKLRQRFPAYVTADPDAVFPP